MTAETRTAIAIIPADDNGSIELYETLEDAVALSWTLERWAATGRSLADLEGVTSLRLVVDGQSYLFAHRQVRKAA